MQYALQQFEKNYKLIILYNIISIHVFSCFLKNVSVGWGKNSKNLLWTIFYTIIMISYIVLGSRRRLDSSDGEEK